MSDREEFEEKFPVPLGVKWCERQQDYTYENYRALDSAASYSGKWQAWQAARAQSGREGISRGCGRCNGSGVIPAADKRIGTWGCKDCGGTGMPKPISRREGRDQSGQGVEAVAWDDPAVDPIVSKLYRKFKEWNRQGFGADDVTWCEVRGYVAELFNAQPQPAVPEGWRECLQEMVQAMYDYEMSVEEDAPYKHRAMMDRAHALLSTPTTPQADGWVRCDERLPTEEDWWVWIYDSEDSDIFHALWRDLKGDYENGHMNLSHWMPTGLKRPQPPKEGG